MYLVAFSFLFSHGTLRMETSLSEIHYKGERMFSRKFLNILRGEDFHGTM